ncbi:hypothetical protein [Natronomonas marina]|jgi:hypothetical protein|uniref:hypothetical protein n=1 Tax=Natronomonas marina TaxID=2961939 RepID=UPI0020C9826E|nr:hypothetical protein [Natronomonas marina]
MAGGPLDGDALVLAAAKASVSGERLPDLVDRAQDLLGGRLPAYGRRYECAHEDDSAAVFFVEEGHWADLGEEMGLDEREWQALRRAHTEHLERLGRDVGRRREFKTALELREIVVIGK